MLWGFWQKKIPHYFKFRYFDKQKNKRGREEEIKKEYFKVPKGLQYLAVSQRGQ